MGTESTNEPWSNWAGNQPATRPAGIVIPLLHCHPTSLGDLVNYVRQAESRSKRVRAVGSSWSFSDVGLSMDYLIETNQLNQILPDLTATRILSALGADIIASGHYLIHVEAGIKVSDLMTILDQNGQAPITMGGSDGQTLAGVISTSVHGADHDRGPIPDFVRAIHLVGPGGVQHWIEPTDGVTDPVHVAATFGIDLANIHYDDDWFNSVLVSVGSMGIIYSVIIEVARQHDLVEVCTHVPQWSALRAQLASGVPFTGTRCVQVAIDPSMVATHPCFLITRTDAPPTGPARNQGIDPLGLFCQGILDVLIGVAGLGLIPIVRAIAPWLPLPPGAELIPGVLATALRAGPPGTLGDVIAAALDGNADWTAQVVSNMTNSALPAGTKRGWAHTIMAGSNPGECASRGLALEMAFDATNNSYLNFVDEALQILDAARSEGFVLGGWLSLRFVGRSRAFLSPQQSARTCMVEAVGLRGLRSTSVLLSRLEAAGRRHCGIQHWGMFSDLDDRDVTRVYPKIDRWREIRRQITNNGTLHTFDNAFTERCGLSRMPEGDVMDVCALGLDGHVWSDAWAATTGWTIWGPVADGSFGAGTPVTAIARTPSNRDLFAVGTDGKVWTTWSLDSGAWAPWFSIGTGTFASGTPVAAVARKAGHLDLFAIGGDGKVWSTWWDATADWAPWFPIGSQAFVQGTTIAAVSRRSDHLDLFAVGLDGTMWSTWWDASSGWATWFRVGGGTFARGTAVSAVARTCDHLDLFAIGTDGRVWSTWWDANTTWADWFPIGAGTFAHDTPVTVVSRTRDHLDLFAIGGDGHVWSTWWDANATWAGWFSIGNATFPQRTAIAAISRHPEHLDLFAISDAGTMQNTSWDASATWAPWSQVGTGLFVPGQPLAAIKR